MNNIDNITKEIEDTVFFDILELFTGYMEKNVKLTDDHISSIIRKQSNHKTVILLEKFSEYGIKLIEDHIADLFFYCPDRKQNDLAKQLKKMEENKELELTEKNLILFSGSKEIYDLIRKGPTKPILDNKEKHTSNPRKYENT